VSGGPCASAGRKGCADASYGGRLQVGTIFGDVAGVYIILIYLI